MLAIFGVLVGFVFGKGSVFKVLKVFVYVCVTVASLITLDFNLFNSLIDVDLHTSPIHVPSFTTSTPVRGAFLNELYVLDCSHPVSVDRFRT